MFEQPAAEPPQTVPAPAKSEGAAVVPSAEAEPVAPADMLPPPSRRERLAWYAGSMVLSALLVSAGLRLDSQDLRAPFYYDLDALLYLPLVKTTLEHGHHWRNDRMGAPGVQELHDFPIIDYLHFGMLRLLGVFIPDMLLVYNLYNLLTYPLTVLTGMWVMRWLKLSLPAAAVGGLLYAFLPYHQERYQYHYFLAAYWVVPLSLVPALAICRGDLPFFARRPDGTYRRKLFSLRSLGYVALGVMVASAGAYYAFFACAAYSFAGLYGWLVFRTWRGAASAALVIAPVVATGVAYHLPTFLYQREYRVNPITQRFPEEAETYGLKLAHLLLPANDHNLTLFARIRMQYSSEGRPADGESAGSLGVVGGAGLVGLVALAVLPHRRRWPEGSLVGLTLFLLLLATVGGFGSVFNLLVTPQIRAYNRISVFVGFLCLFAAMWWLDRFLLTRTSRRMQRLRYPIWAAVFLVGFLDQTPYSWFKPKVITVIDKHAERFRADKRFFAKVEAAAPGARVFCLPYIPFPESPPAHKMEAYEHARGYLMTDTLSWSFGAVKGREADAWQREVSNSPPDELLRRVAAGGFDGLFIDGRGFAPVRGADRAAELINRINQLYRTIAGAGQLPLIVHEDGKQFFLDLRPYRDAYQRVDPVGFAQAQTREREWVAALWLDGFFRPEPPFESERTVWGPPDGTLVLVNPTDRERSFTISFTIGVDVAGPFRVTISSDDAINDEFPVDKIVVEGDHEGRRIGWPKNYEKVKVKPGRTNIRIRCYTPHYFRPGDSRNLCYFIKDFKMVEVPGP
jgi:hypothetical protein